MTYGLSNGTSTRLPRGQYASVWVKWTPTRQCNFRLRLFTSPTVTADNFSDSAFYRDASVTILANNTEWVELRVELDPEQVYYGICLLTIKSTKMIINELSQYIYVDDICIYNSISPWGNN